MSHPASPTRTSSYPHRVPKLLPAAAPLPRRQTTQLTTTSAPSRLLLPTVRLDSGGSDWLGFPARFDVVQHQIQVQGYQIYAVEKWIVERNRPVTVLAVYTGNPNHKVSLTALAPSQSLSSHDAQSEWDNAIQHLRRDGARPRETPHGILMATSLAHFRSDYTIVHIPDGNFLAVREQLYTNINLLRMGCSGRSALTLEEPSDTTKDRFISTYYLPENTLPETTSVTSTDFLPLPPALTKTRSHSHSNSNSHHGSMLSFHSPPSKYDPASSPTSTSKAKFTHKTNTSLGLPGVIPHDDLSKPREKPKTMGKTKDPALFNATVLELVKLIQAGLSIFGMFGTPGNTHIDGLLCDDTVEGIRKWTIGVGEPCVGLEPMERIADPTFVSALLSLILAIRNKLAALGFTHVVPKDPFLQPSIFAFALAAYVHANSTTSPLSPTPHHHTTAGTSSSATTTPSQSLHGHGYMSSHSVTFGTPYIVGYGFPQTQPPLPLPAPPPTAALASAVLTRELVEAISAAYEAKGRAAEGRGAVRRALRGKLEDLTRGAGDSDGDGSGERRGTMSGGEGGGGRDGISGVGGSGGGGSTSGVGSGAGIASSGGQLLSGIASGLGLGSGTGGVGGGAVVEGTFDLAGFVKMVVGKESKGKGKGKGKAREGKGESRDKIGIGYGYGYGREKEKDAVVGISVRGLWSGGVTTVIRLRQREAEWELGGRDRIGEREKGKDRWALSDGDVDEPVRNNEKFDGRSTEEESDIIGTGGFGGRMWGEKVQKKLESWTGLARKRGHMSLDLSSPSASKSHDGGKASHNDPLSTARPRKAEVQPQSPTLPPMVFVGTGEPDPDDDDLLSSGQVSPIDNLRPPPFNIFHSNPSESASINTEHERKVTEFNQKRPWNERVYQSRVSSWADPVSARGVLDGDVREGEAGRGDSKKAKAKEKSRLAEGDEVSEIEGVSKEGVYGLEERSDSEYEVPRRETLMYGPQRRRSFHDLSSLQDMRVLTIERMKVDVELCGQLLIMTRREEHLKNVLSCLYILTNSLADTNALLREDYQAHVPFLSHLEARTKVMSDIDAQNAKADKTSQATHTLRYESEQFRVPDLWHTATPPRQKVFELREKMFGTGGRRLPAGVHGAHGRFNRLQWTLDGKERLVDYLGRTESEAEEESAVDPDGSFILPPEEDEEDVVEHPGIKPMWLLRFFTSWGARWGATTHTSGEDDAAKKVTDTVKGTEAASDANGDNSLPIEPKNDAAASSLSSHLT